MHKLKFSLSTLMRSMEASSLLTSDLNQSSTARRTACQLTHALLGRNAPPKRRLKTCVTALVKCRWLLKRARGVLMLHHRGQTEKGGIEVSITDENRRDQQIVPTTIPFILDNLSPKAKLHLDLGWGTSTSKACHVLAPYRQHINRVFVLIDI